MSHLADCRSEIYCTKSKSAFEFIAFYENEGNIERERPEEEKSGRDGEKHPENRKTIGKMNEIEA